ncbi:hypothetical protein D1007_37920 [Hordeum vulgare]|nr:hypothetical protein D1007_37920 [Hordeum vulgare]
MDFFNGKGKRKAKLSIGASSFRGLLSSLPARRGSPPARERLYIRVHHARWHWQYRRPLQFPNVNLAHGWHLDPQRISIPTVPRSTWAHVEEVRERREDLTPEQQAMRAYAPNSSNWEHWFALEHEEERR